MQNPGFVASAATPSFKKARRNGRGAVCEPEGAHAADRQALPGIPHRDHPRHGPRRATFLLQQESCREANMPLEIIVAMTQGQIGYMIESTLDRA